MSTGFSFGSNTGSSATGGFKLGGTNTGKYNLKGESTYKGCYFSLF